MPSPPRTATSRRSITVALDCLAVYVHRDNPIESLTFAQLDGIFSKTRKTRRRRRATWGQVGLTGDWAPADQPLRP